MLNPEKKKRAREEFAHLEGIVYLNTGATSIPPKCVQEAYAQDMAEFVRDLGRSHTSHESQKTLKALLAGLVGADASEIALTGNTTAGFDAITMGYPWDPGKDVILYGYEHPSNLVDWVKREEEGKLRLKIADPSPGGICADDIIKLIDGNTQAVTISLVQYWDGARVDIGRIGKACREAGALLIVDGIQAMGRLNVNVGEMGIDFLSSGGHKGLLCRTGTGFLYCSKRIIEKVAPFHGSFQSICIDTKITAPEYDKKLHWFGDARKFENGNHNDQGYAGMKASLEFIHEMGIQEIESEILSLQEVFYARLGELAEKVKPRGDMPSGILYVPYDEKNRDKVEGILNRHKVIASIRPSNVRLCMNFHNTNEEMAIAAQAVKDILVL